MNRQPPEPYPETEAQRSDDLAEGRWQPRRGRGFKVMVWLILAMIVGGLIVMLITIVQYAMRLDWGLAAADAPPARQVFLVEV